MYFGMDYGGTNIKTGIFNDNGETVFFVENKLTEFTTKGDLLSSLLDHAKSTLKDYNIKSGGLAIKGLVNSKTGFLEEDIGEGKLLAGKNLKKIFSDELQIPFSISNDARAYSWGEYKFGAGRTSKTMACLTLGTGVGSALVVNGKPYDPGDPLGGLLGGHISIDRNGPECPCGNIGCLELYCSATAFTQIVKDKHPEFIESKNILPDFFDALRNNKNKYLKTLNEFQNNLSIGIVNIIHAYGPDTVVIGGGVMNSADLILPRLIELVHKRAWTYPRGKVKIKKSELGNKAAALGAAFL